jgi:hypothetical protein
MHAQLPGLIERLLARTGRQPETVLRFVARDGAETAVCAGDFVGDAFGLLAALRGAGLRPGSVVAIRGALAARTTSPCRSLRPPSAAWSAFRLSHCWGTAMSS